MNTNGNPSNLYSYSSDKFAIKVNLIRNTRKTMTKQYVIAALVETFCETYDVLYNLKH